MGPGVRRDDVGDEFTHRLLHLCGGGAPCPAGGTEPRRDGLAIGI